MLNEVFLIGNLGNDVDLHFFDGGGCVGKFSLATSESYTSKSGEKINKTQWHNISVFNKAAENCEKYLKKGSKVFVKGSIEYREWTAEDGSKRYGTDIKALTVKFLDSKSSGASGGSPSAPPQERGSSPGPAAREKHAGDDFLSGNDRGGEDDHDDLPF